MKANEAQAAARARGRERPAEEAAGRGRAGQVDAQGAGRGKLLTPERRRRAVVVLVDRFGVSRTSGLPRRRSAPLDPAARRRGLARRRRTSCGAGCARSPGAHPRWGWKTAHTILRREGHTINRKRTRRLWRDEGLRRPAPCKRKRTRPPGGGPLLRAERPEPRVGARLPVRRDRRPPEAEAVEHRRRAHPRSAGHARRPDLRRRPGRRGHRDPRRRARRTRASAHGQRARAHRLGAAGLVPARRHRPPPTSSRARRGRTRSSRASTAASATSC